SPAREFIDGGEDIVRGAVIGIDRNAKNAYKSAARMGQSVIDGFGDPTLDVATSMSDARSITMADISASIQPTAAEDRNTRPIIEIHNHGDLEMIRTEIHERDAIDASDPWAKS